MKAVLGIDTSCYTTSAALVGTDGKLIAADRKLLHVEPGARGLMQSEMVFQHICSLPERIEAVLGAAEDIQVAAVCASTRPRPAEESYMPAFRAGESQARTAASLLRVPFYMVSHQEGHVAAACYLSDIDQSRPFLAFHLSGGTTEMLLCTRNELKLISGSLDLHAGQFVDRTGVRMHLPFPAGPALEALAIEGAASSVLPVSMRGLNCSISGAENGISRLLESGVPAADVAAEVYDFLTRTILRMIMAAADATGADQVILAGGVASSKLLRERLLYRAERKRLKTRIYFARPELSGDNAVGVALLGVKQYHMGQI